MTRRSLTESPEKTPQYVEHREPQSDSAQSFPGGLHPIHQLQRTLGNRRVAQLIQAKRLTAGGKMMDLQRQLTVGAADDLYEQEAGRVARHAMHTSDAVVAHSMQRAMSPEEAQDQMLQPKPLAASITPFEQRQMGQNAALEDEEQPIQAKLLTETSHAPVQRQPEPEEEDTESLQAKSAGALTDSFEAGADVETQVSLSKGRGSPLPDPVRAYMEPRFGIDFSQVRAHTGSDALQMNQAVEAQAFTHGSDIYFGAGHSPTNLELTAHELTHVVQQTGGAPLKTKKREQSVEPSTEPSVQRNCPSCAANEEEIVQRRVGEGSVPMNPTPTSALPASASPLDAVAPQGLGPIAGSTGSPAAENSPAPSPRAPGSGLARRGPAFGYAPHASPPTAPDVGAVGPMSAQSLTRGAGPAPEAGQRSLAAAVPRPVIVLQEMPPVTAEEPKSAPRPAAANAAARESKVREAGRSFSRLAEQTLGLEEGYAETADRSNLGLPPEGEAQERSASAMGEISAATEQLQAQTETVAEEKPEVPTEEPEPAEKPQDEVPPEETPEAVAAQAEAFSAPSDS